VSYTTARLHETAQLTWFFDPVAGSDKLDGATALTAIKTWREFSRRVGLPFFLGPASALAETITFNWLSDQPDDSDPVIPVATLSNIDFVMKGVLIQVAAGTFGAVTNLVRTPVQLTTGVNANGAAPANYWTAFVGMLVHDVNNDTWFTVDADLGARTAQFTQPFTGIPVDPRIGLNAEGTINLGDAYVVYRFPKIFVGPMTVQGTAPREQLTLFQHLEFSLAGGGFIGAESWTRSNNAVAFQECLFNGFVNLANIPEQLVVYNCVFRNGFASDGSIIIGGSIAPFLTALGPTVVDGDVLVHGPLEIWQYLAVCKAYFDTTLDVPFNSLAFPNFGTLNLSDSLGNYGAAILYGPAGIAVHSNGFVMYESTAVAQIQCTGPLTIQGLATGAKITPGTPRVVTDGVNITPAAIDDVAAGKVPGMIGSGGAGAVPGFFKFA
jgi:hypothetical protein